MPERLTILLTVALVLVLLVALNAASYVRVEEVRDSEVRPDRSTVNTGATGTRAFYELLEEAGYSVVRWRDAPASLSKPGGADIRTFVVVGEVRREFKQDEARTLLRWVHGGGRLVLIDRSPDASLLPTSGRWRVGSESVEWPDQTVRSDDREAMTRGVSPIAPVQPSLLTRGVREVARSRFAGRLHIYTIDEKSAAAEAEKTATDEAQDGWPFGSGKKQETGDAGAGDAGASDAGTGDDEGRVDDASSSAATPPPVAAQATLESEVVITTGEAAEGSAREWAGSPAPVRYLSDGREGGGSLLVDYVYGRGRIVVLSDPFIVSNAGLALGDNLSLAVNLVAAPGGRVAFDEYHQGRGATENMLLGYFKGTPVLSLAAQVALVLLAVVWTQSRRFARPLPAPRIDRRSNLEFVASMAELQQRARAYDLAIENIYGRTRRALARYAGVAASATNDEIAARVAARSGRDTSELRALLAECEDAIAGVHISARRALQIIARLRELESELGIRMRAREIRQARPL